MAKKIFLTFDCEDFINTRSIFVLYRILELLLKYNLKGLFFLTGHMAEKISNHPKILDLLEGNEIGYHSSAHSVRPTIIEYTDVKDYLLAHKISLNRETSHIKPLTGEPEGKGGITFLKSLFPAKQIISFRAPGFCWSPPHLEGLKKLGIQFDFSTDISSTPVNYKGITFYPSPILIDIINIREYVSKKIFSIIKSHLAVLVFHPNQFVNINNWDSIYFTGNPKRLFSVQARSWKDTKTILRKFELLLKYLAQFQKRDLLEVTPCPKKSGKEQTFTMKWVSEIYRKSVVWSKKYLDYHPKFVYKHFMNFFNVNKYANSSVH